MRNIWYYNDNSITHLDNELPEYIMIMVANKKTQSQMTDDLSLFLNHKTTTFTKWLDELIKKLESTEIPKKVIPGF